MSSEQSDNLNKRSPALNEDQSNKKPKTDNMASENTQNAQMFSSVGEAAQLVDDSQEMRPNPELGATGEGITMTTAADAEGHPVQEIESMCMSCEQTGVTRMLLTKIPFFREIIIMSFSCPHCGFKNSEIQSAGEIQEKGSKYTLRLETKSDLNRQVIKSDYCSCKFAELDIEIPAKRGQFTNVEGLLGQIRDDLASDQPARKIVDPDTYGKIEPIIAKLTQAIDGELLPLTLIVDDPSGNSWVEFVPEEASHKWSHIQYFRTKQQNIELGVSAPPLEGEEERPTIETSTTSDRNTSVADQIATEASEIENLNTEVQTFNATCSICFEPCPTHMKVVNIPHFTDVIIMSTSCDHCGYKSNEVKTGGAVPEKGRKVTLKVTDPDDLARDILKSETCGLTIPELNLDLNPGTLGGRFTTIEGLLAQVYEELHSKVFSGSSDSMDESTKTNWTIFLSRLQDAIDGKMEFTLVMTDPLAASYIQNVYAPDPDPEMQTEEFERTFEQNEDLGLNDMVV